MFSQVAIVLILFTVTVYSQNGDMQRFRGANGYPLFARVAYQRKGMQRSELPSFLKDASEDAKIKVKQVIIDKELPVAEKDKIIDEIMMNESDKVKEDYLSFKAEVSLRKKELSADHERRRTRLSEQAKKVDEQLWNISQDENLSANEKRDQMKKVLEGLSDTIKRELKEMKKEGKRDRKNKGISRKMEEVRQNLENHIENVGDNMQQIVRMVISPIKRMKGVSDLTVTKGDIKMSEDGDLIELN